MTLTDNQKEFRRSADLSLTEVLLWKHEWGLKNMEHSIS